MIKKLLPGKIKNQIRLWVKSALNFKDYSEHYNEFLRIRKNTEEAIPKVDLENRHIRNAVLLLNRAELLARMPVQAICAEIGVNKGEFSEQILKTTNPKKLHLIDIWGDPGRYHDGLKAEVGTKFHKELNTGQVEINIGYSTEVLSKMPDNYFDWVYLDTAHTYDITAQELSVLKSKMKQNGIIAGHDYILGNWTGDVRYGVIEAVNEFCLNENWEIAFITMNKNEMPSFAIKKIQ